MEHDRFDSKTLICSQPFSAATVHSSGLHKRFHGCLPLIIIVVVFLRRRLLHAAAGESGGLTPHRHGRGLYATKRPMLGRQCTRGGGEGGDPGKDGGGSALCARGGHDRLGRGMTREGMRHRGRGRSGGAGGDCPMEFVDGAVRIMEAVVPRIGSGRSNR